MRGRGRRDPPRPAHRGAANIAFAMFLVPEARARRPSASGLRRGLGPALPRGRAPPRASSVYVPSSPGVGGGTEEVVRVSRRLCSAAAAKSPRAGASEAKRAAAAGGRRRRRRLRASASTPPINALPRRPSRPAIERGLGAVERRRRRPALGPEARRDRRSFGALEADRHRLLVDARPRAGRRPGRSRSARGGRDLQAAAPEVTRSCRRATPTYRVVEVRDVAAERHRRAKRANLARGRARRSGPSPAPARRRPAIARKSPMSISPKALAGEHERQVGGTAAQRA